MEKLNNACCFTGYRPQKFPFELKNGEHRYTELLRGLSASIEQAVKNGCDTFYCGMACGFDIIAGEAVLALKEKFGHIKLIAVIPYPEQSKSYTEDWSLRYQKLLAAADDKILISQVYTKYCFAKRNNYMVDNSGTVITWYNGEKGGTDSTLKYAAKKGRNIININQQALQKYNLPIIF